MKEPLINAASLVSSTIATIDNSEPYNLLPTSQQHSSADGIAAIIGALNNEDTVHFVTEGAWSHYQLVMATVLDYTGPCMLYCSTYAMSEISVRSLSKLIDEGFLKQLHCVIDNRVETRSAGSLQMLKNIANSCILSACHAKVTILIGKSKSALIIGSANWTENKRIEVGAITSNLHALEFHLEWIKKIIAHGG